jgi:hypothetical protein
MADSILTGMSKREVFIKTILLIILPFFVVYLAFLRPEPAANCLLCVESAASPAVSNITLFGDRDSVDFNSPIVGRAVADRRLLARFVTLSLRLHRYKPDVTDLKLSTRSYRLVINKSLDTCQVELLRTKSGRELISCYSGAYYECPQLVAFADSLFWHAPAALQ